MKSIGVIDIGTNTILCLKAATDSKRFEIISDKRFAYRVGCRLDNDGNISAEYKQSLRQKLMAALADLIDCAKIKIVATEVFRRPKDGVAFAIDLSAELGQEIEIIDSHREAELSFLGATERLGEISSRAAVIDIGGGSTEIAVGENGKLAGWSGLQLGAVAISEAVGFEQKLPQYLDYALDTFRHSNFLDLLTPNVHKVLVVGGTAVTLAGLSLGLNDFQPEKLQGLSITEDSLERLLEKLAKVDLGQRKKLLAFDPERADIIVGGGAIILAFMQYSGIKNVTVSIRGLRYGLLSELVGK